ncbi:MAG: ferredoxin--NADP+ reductase [Kiritimatiellia bacterium]|jgi:ferredoxin/flavodoxin---NADP+ reductase
MTEHQLLPVQEIRWHGDGIYELRLDRQQIAFTPGDCFALFAEDQEASRPYSVASGADDPFLAFIIRRMPGGEVSDFLAGLQPGDLVKVSPPFGWFRPGQANPGTPFVFIATGTGISPFMCHFRSRPDHPPVSLLYGVREVADAVELDWLQRACDVKLAVSREQGNGHHHGRVTDLLPGIALLPQTQFYLCGLDAMIDDATVWLEGQGVELSRIHRECFFNANYD